jgi:hypothetical protein
LAALAAGIVSAAFDAAVVAARRAEAFLPVARPIVEFVLAPPLIPTRFQPRTGITRLVNRGERARLEAEREVDALANQLIPVILAQVLDRIDLTQLVLERVKLDQIIDSVDVNAVAAKLDIDPIIDRVPMDKVVDRVPIDRVIDRVDVNEVASKVDIGRILDRVDVNAVAATVNVDAIIARVDLAGLANEVVEDIDLPKIIRESSGAMASETVVGVRLRSAHADERINHIIDRMLLRRRARQTQAPASPEARDDRD